MALASADWKPTVALRMPLLASPAAAARRGAAEAQVKQAEHGLRAALDAGRLELETAWTGLEATAERAGARGSGPGEGPPSRR